MEPDTGSFVAIIGSQPATSIVDAAQSPQQDSEVSKNICTGDSIPVLSSGLVEVENAW